MQRTRSRINTDDIEPNALYTADDIAALLNVHRTTVHQRIFKVIGTTRIGRSKVTTGARLIQHLRGETVAPADAS